MNLAVIVMKQDSRVLLGESEYNYGNHTWSFPNGELKDRESFEACALRICKRDCGSNLNVRLIDKEPCKVTNDMLNRKVTLFFRAKYLYGEPEIKEPEKYKRWLWLSWATLSPSNQKLSPSIRDLLNKGYTIFKI